MIATEQLFDKIDFYQPQLLPIASPEIVAEKFKKFADTRCRYLRTMEQVVVIPQWGIKEKEGVHLLIASLEVMAEIDDEVAAWLEYVLFKLNDDEYLRNAFLKDVRTFSYDEDFIRKNLIEQSFRKSIVTLVSRMEKTLEIRKSVYYGFIAMLALFESIHKSHQEQCRCE